MGIKQTIALSAGGAIIAVAGAFGVAHAFSGDATSDTTTQSAQAPGDQQNGQQQPSRNGGDASKTMAAALAEKLGVDESTVQTALQEAMQANRPSDSGSGTNGDNSSRPDPSERNETLATTLAEKLGVDKDKVLAALNEIGPGMGGPGGSGQGGPGGGQGAPGSGSDGQGSTVEG